MEDEKAHQPSVDEMPAGTVEVRELVADGGRSPYQDWYRGLRDKIARARIAGRIARVRSGNFGDFKPVGKGVYELRVDYGPGYRIYFGRVGDVLVILIGGGDKSTQEKDIKRAQDLWEQNRGSVNDNSQPS